MVQSLVACSNASMSKLPDGCWKVIKFKEAKLHAVSSRNIYSEHGLEAFILPSPLQVCQSLIVVSNCIPGSADAHAAFPISSHRSLALIVL